MNGLMPNCLNFYLYHTENTDFVTRCPQNRMFKNKGLSVRPLEVTEQVAVEDIRHFSEDLLRLYFENAGGDVENITLDEVEQSAVITFKDLKGKLVQVDKRQLPLYEFWMNWLMEYLTLNYFVSRSCSESH